MLYLVISSQNIIRDFLPVINTGKKEEIYVDVKDFVTLFDEEFAIYETKVELIRKSIKRRTIVHDVTWGENGRFQAG